MRIFLFKHTSVTSPEAVRAARDYICQNYFDVRTFGAVMSTGNDPCGIVRGPVKISFAKSVDPIFTQDITIKDRQEQMKEIVLLWAERA